MNFTDRFQYPIFHPYCEQDSSLVLNPQEDFPTYEPRNLPVIVDLTMVPAVGV
jgi:hypothetical protein